MQNSLTSQTCYFHLNKALRFCYTSLEVMIATTLYSIKKSKRKTREMVHPCAGSIEHRVKAARFPSLAIQNRVVSMKVA